MNPRIQSEVLDALDLYDRLKVLVVAFTIINTSIDVA